MSDQIDVDKQRARLALFFSICGCNAGALEVCKGDPQAFWPNLWAAMTPVMRRLLLNLCAEHEIEQGKVKREADFYLQLGMNSQMMALAHWRGLSEVVRDLICTVSPWLAHECQQKFRRL